VKGWIAFFAFLCMAAPALGQERPLRTEDPEIMATGLIRTGIGVEFLHRQRYSVSGLEGDLLRLGVATVRIGVGEYAEFQIEGVVHDFLAVTKRNPPAIPPSFTGNSTSDYGDLVFGTKLKLASEKSIRPAVSAAVAVQLANESDASGLGTNENEFYAYVLLAKKVRGTKFLGNLGIAVLGNPLQGSSQADMMTYGFGIIAPLHRRLDFMAEVNGRHGPEHVGNESRSRIRAGVRFRAAGLMWDVAGIAGLKQYDACCGLTVGVTFDVQAFHKKRTPTVVR
jgi:hypothetical protein